MTGLLIAQSALGDLEAIWTYTSRAWNIEQADNYILTLHRDMARLLDYPELGPQHQTRVGPFRKLASGHHLIFYQVRDGHVLIVRILHERMDAERQLGEGPAEAD